MNRIDGTPQALEEYKGKVVLIVNTASKCGLTPQYEALQTLYDAYKDRGLVVLGFPANQFNDQEPGTNAEITAFCTQNYGVTFPMFEKTVVKGEGTCPLYQQLSALTAEPNWNFTKFLVNRQGELVDRIDPQTSPTDPMVVARIESLLEG
ncbi:MAG: glutathione peroxidase [Leptolyngbya sp. PLA3]|nr:MAG: glutathione peroxidase [Cyanobacteria bacterium CYA]MCE7968168.1 glutathione peroxidase [Leptolyngbya sp. PL-A3]